MATSGDGGGRLATGKACRLTNTTYWDASSSVPLASLPLFCGAPERDLRLFDDQARPVDRPEILAQAGKIADLLRDTDVSYLYVPLTSTHLFSVLDSDFVVSYSSPVLECQLHFFLVE